MEWQFAQDGWQELDANSTKLIGVHWEGPMFSYGLQQANDSVALSPNFQTISTLKIKTIGFQYMF